MEGTPVLVSLIACDIAGLQQQNKLQRQQAAVTRLITTLFSPYPLIYLILLCPTLAFDLRPELGDLHLLALDLLHLLALFILSRLKPGPLADLFPAILVMVMMTSCFHL